MPSRLNKTILKPFKMKGCTVVPKFLVHGCADLARPGRSPNLAAVSNGKISSPKNDQHISLQISVYFFHFLSISSCENLVNLLILYISPTETPWNTTPRRDISRCLIYLYPFLVSKHGANKPAASKRSHLFWQPRGLLGKATSQR